VVLEKDGGDQLNLSCKKMKILLQSRREGVSDKLLKKRYG
jgi:hypothetical protein